jgi:hypothetical protein
VFKAFYIESCRDLKEKKTSATQYPIRKNDDRNVFAGKKMNLPRNIFAEKNESAKK